MKYKTVFVAFASFALVGTSLGMEKKEEGLKSTSFGKPPIADLKSCSTEFNEMLKRFDRSLALAKQTAAFAVLVDSGDPVSVKGQ